MKNLSRVLNRLMDEKGMTQLELAALTAFQQSKISRILSSQSRITPEDLSILLRAFPDAGDRYQIVLAQIQDELPAEALTAVDIKRFNGPEILRETYTADVRNLSHQGESALAYLLQLVKEVPSIQDVIIDLARALGWNESQLPRAIKPQPREVTSYGAEKRTEKAKKKSADAERQAIGEDIIGNALEKRTKHKP